MGGIFGKKKTWDDLPVAMDGWMVSHDSLRYLMTLIRNTFDKLIADAEAGNLTKENVARFATFFEHFYKEVHNHHDHEEKIFFPWMETKVKLPPKMSADHKTLIANLDDVKRHIEKLEGASAGAEELEILKAGQASFVNMQEHMCELPQLIYQMDDQSRMRFMKTAGIPSLIIALVIKKQIRRFQREIMDPFVAIGQEVPPRAAASA